MKHYEYEAIIALRTCTAHTTASTRHTDTSVLVSHGDGMLARIIETQVSTLTVQSYNYGKVDCTAEHSESKIDSKYIGLASSI